MRANADGVDSAGLSAIQAGSDVAGFNAMGPDMMGSNASRSESPAPGRLRTAARQRSAHSRLLRIAPGGLLALLVPSVRAHCPLCTAGVAAVAGGAMFLGVKAGPIGILVGAFAISTSLLAAKYLPKKIKYQTAIIGLAGLFLTVIPLTPLIPGRMYPLYLPMFGTYGTTLVINSFAVGSLIGAALFLAGHPLSAVITKVRGKMLFPYQGLVLTILMLVTAAAAYQVI